MQEHCHDWPKRLVLGMERAAAAPQTLCPLFWRRFSQLFQVNKGREACNDDDGVDSLRTCRRFQNLHPSNPLLLSPQAFDQMRASSVLTFGLTIKDSLRRGESSLRREYYLTGISSRKPTRRTAAYSRED